MRAIVRDRYGTAEVLQLVDAPPPSPGPDQVLVEVHGSSTNMGDWLVMAGIPGVMRLGLGLFRPKATGCGQDVAGRVLAVGEGVTGLAVGDAVYGEATGGAAWAEQALVPAGHLGRTPANHPLAELGSVPLARMTALQAVAHGRVSAGSRVLVNGGSGSVGSYAVQIAKARGAHVTAVCSADQAARARSLGADAVIDYRTESFADRPERYDALLDVAGRTPMTRCLAVLNDGGTFVAVGGDMKAGGLRPILRLLWMTLRGAFSRHRVVVFAAAVSRAAMDELTGLLGSGAVRPCWDSECTLDALPAAMADVDAGRRRGKVLVLVR